MFIVTLFTIAKQPKCPRIDEGLKKMWCVYMYMCLYIHIYIYIKEYYSITKKNKILPFAATWMDLEGITLSEISHRETNTV